MSSRRSYPPKFGGTATGKIKTFNEKRGFGFIEREGEDDLFVHVTDLRGAGPRELHVGDQVSFEVAPSNKGPRAVNVRVQIAVNEKPFTPSTRE